MVTFRSRTGSMVTVGVINYFSVLLLKQTKGSAPSKDSSHTAKHYSPEPHLIRMRTERDHMQPSPAQGSFSAIVSAMRLTARVAVSGQPCRLTCKRAIVSSVLQFA